MKNNSRGATDKLTAKLLANDLDDRMMKTSAVTEAIIISATVVTTVTSFLLLTTLSTNVVIGIAAAMLLAIAIMNPPPFLMTLPEGITKVIENVIETIVDKFKKGKAIIDNFFKNLFDGITTWLEDKIIKPTTEFFNKIAKGITEKVTDLLDRVAKNKYFKQFADFVEDIKKGYYEWQKQYVEQWQKMIDSFNRDMYEAKINVKYQVSKWIEQRNLELKNMKESYNTIIDKANDTFIGKKINSSMEKAGDFFNPAFEKLKGYATNARKSMSDTYNNAATSYAKMKMENLEIQAGRIQKDIADTKTQYDNNEKYWRDEANKPGIKQSTKEAYIRQADNIKLAKEIKVAELETKLTKTSAKISTTRDFSIKLDDIRIQEGITKTGTWAKGGAVDKFLVSDTAEIGGKVLEWGYFATVAYEYGEADTEASRKETTSQFAGTMTIMELAAGIATAVVTALGIAVGWVPVAITIVLSAVGLIFAGSLATEQYNKLRSWIDTEFPAGGSALSTIEGAIHSVMEIINDVLINPVIDNLTTWWDLEQTTGFFSKMKQSWSSDGSMKGLFDSLDEIWGKKNSSNLENIDLNLQATVGAIGSYATALEVFILTSPTKITKDILKTDSTSENLSDVHKEDLTKVIGTSDDLHRTYVNNNTEKYKTYNTTNQTKISTMEALQKDLQIKLKTLNAKLGRF